MRKSKFQSKAVKFVMVVYITILVLMLNFINAMGFLIFISGRINSFILILLLLSNASVVFLGISIANRLSVKRLVTKKIIKIPNIFPTEKELTQFLDINPGNGQIYLKVHLLSLIRLRLIEIFTSLPKFILKKFSDSFKFPHWNFDDIFRELLNEYNLESYLFTRYSSYELLQNSSFQINVLNTVELEDIQLLYTTPKEKLIMIIALIPFKLRKLQLKRSYIRRDILKYDTRFESI